MPNYTFLCESCGEFTEHHKSTLGSKLFSECPECQSVTKRLFKPTARLRMNSVLKRKIEKGIEPQFVTRDQLPPKKRSSPSKTAQRPWQVGH